MILLNQLLLKTPQQLARENENYKSNLQNNLIYNPSKKQQFLIQKYNFGKSLQSQLSQLKKDADFMKEYVKYGHRKSSLFTLMSLFNPGFVGRVGAAGGWDYEDDFSSYADQTAADAVWDKNVTNVQVDVSADNLKFSSDNVSANWSVANDLASRGSLPALLSDTAWVSRHILNFTTVQASDGCGVTACYFGFSTIGKTNSGSGGVSEDWLGWFVASGNDFYAGEQNEGLLNTSSGAAMTTGLTTGLQYMEQIRLSSTSFKCEAFANSDWTSSNFSATHTIDSTIQSLQYAVWRKWANTGVCGASPTVGTIDDFKITDGVTVAP